MYCFVLGKIDRCALKKPVSSRLETVTISKITNEGWENYLMGSSPTNVLVVLDFQTIRKIAWELNNIFKYCKRISIFKHILYKVK